MPSLGEIVKGKIVRFIDEGKTVLEAAEYMDKHNVGAVPVLNGDRLVGIFSERDLMRRCVTKKLDMAATKVEEVMTERVIVMEASDSYEDCLRIMKQENIRHIPVIDGDKLVGVISIRDLMQVDMDEKEQKIDILNSYIHYNPKGV
ncbi:MAG: CBS domain-containing protein [Ignavibacteria bacterium]